MTVSASCSGSTSSGTSTDDPAPGRFDHRPLTGVPAAAVARLVEPVAVHFDDEVLGTEEDVDLDPPRKVGDAGVCREAREVVVAEDLDEAILGWGAGRRRSVAELALEPGRPGCVGWRLISARSWSCVTQSWTSASWSVRAKASSELSDAARSRIAWAAVVVGTRRQTLWQARGRSVSV